MKKIKDSIKEVKNITWLRPRKAVSLGIVMIITTIILTFIIYGVNIGVIEIMKLIVR